LLEGGCYRMTIFKTALKRCMKKPMIIITLLIMPLVCLAIDYPFSSSSNNKVLNNFTVAICDKDNSIASSALLSKISSEYNVQKISPTEVNTVLTNKNSDWAIVIPKGFQNNLGNNENPLIEGYGFTGKEKWEPVKLNIENMIASMRIICNTRNSEVLEKNLNSWIQETTSSKFSFLKRSKGPLLPGTGLTLYGMIILYGAFLLARMFVEDKETELTSRIATTPIPPWRYLLENLACFSVILIVQNIFVITAYSLIIPQGLVHPILLVTAFGLFSITAVGLMLTISTLCNTSFVMLCASTGAVMILSMLGGLFVPVSFMPDTMKKLAMITPTYWFSEAINSIFSGGSQFTFQITMLLGFAIVFFLVGSWKKYSKLD
jgi:ABC-2 type transport system permease protein